MYISVKQYYCKVQCFKNCLDLLLLSAVTLSQNNVKTLFGPEILLQPACHVISYLYMQVFFDGEKAQGVH